MESLSVISYTRLMEGDQEEEKRLLESCSAPGIFYIDLGGTDITPKLIDTLLDAGKHFFNLELPEKLRISRDELKSYFG
jgi:isopenicillin N synthase-like dioxygenase